MKLSRHKDCSKASEISIDDNDNTLMQLHGTTAIKAVHGTSGQISDVAQITQTGEFDFVARPSVGGVDVALATDGESSLETQQLTIADSQTYSIAVGPVQRLTTVIYAISQNGVSESGTVQISQSSTGFDIFPVRTASPGYYAQIEFSATDSNGQLMLNVVGLGAGLLHTFEYRVNAVNTLYL